MLLHVINNNKNDPNEVPVVAPPNARVWTFTDVDNDYGIPEHHTKAYTHNNRFRDEECMDSTSMREISVQPYRHIYMAGDPAMHMLNEAWTVSDNKYIALTPNYIYDFKKHSGYRECVISSGGFALEYECKDVPLSLFPGETSHTLNFTPTSGIVKETIIIKIVIKMH